MVAEVSPHELCARNRYLMKAHEYNPAVRVEHVKKEYDIMRKPTHDHIAKVLWWGIDEDPDTYSIYMQQTTASETFWNNASKTGFLKVLSDGSHRGVAVC